MSEPRFHTLDGNEAVARVAYKLSEVIAIYPITPSSPMGEWADAWAAAGKPNLWGTVPSVVEMQSEGGAAGVIHGALQTGALATTFTASQGLLLMIPNMYKIAGELTPAVFHIAARALAAQALSIFGDHSDVMAARATGWAMLCSNSVQEAQDLALVAHAATLETRIPFVHFFDGFRTSHEVAKIEILPDETIRALVSEERIREHRDRRLSPEQPVVRGTAQNPDVYFQGRESVNRFYAQCAGVVRDVMERFATLTGRRYGLFDYAGAPDAERVIVMMGSGCEAAQEAVEHLCAAGEKVGLVKVRLYRPFDSAAFVAALPGTVKSIAVLDRTKEPGSAGEPLCLDVIQALYTVDRNGHPLPRVVGGRYGLGSKEFTPAMAKAALDNLRSDAPKRSFTVGIVDDVTGASLDVDESFTTETDAVRRAVFFGLGSDGTVGANKESIKIIGENTDNYAQAYFVYDSKKSGAITISHLRFGKAPIRSTYLIDQAQFVACHQSVFLGRYDVVAPLAPGGVFLLNAPWPKEEVWSRLPVSVQEALIAKRARLYAINATQVARDAGMGGRINTVMQTCFFAVSGVLPRGEAIAAIKNSIRKTYGRKGEEIVQMNLKAVDNTIDNLFEIPLGTPGAPRREVRPPALENGSSYVREVLAPMLAGRGDRVPVSRMPVDGTFPTGTARLEKRNLALEIPVWDPTVCIQCGKCVLVCPHAVIRSKVCPAEQLASAPEGFKSADCRIPIWKGLKFTIQVSPEDCTGCALCVDICPAKNKKETRLKAINMAPQAPIREEQNANWDYFLRIREFDRRKLSTASVREMQVAEPLFEFSGACAGCGETPYVKLLTQLFGDRLVIANATGCSSIYGGNLPTTPYCANREGRGPAWSNSLFEDNAEFGLGFRVSIDKQQDYARELLTQLAPRIGDGLTTRILLNQQRTEADIFEQRENVTELKRRLANLDGLAARRLIALADMLVRKSVWILGGDGWAYDIGYGGLDHVLASGRNVKVLVLDTEVYSNTGGQMSKSTPRGAIAKFAAGGKPHGKKDLGLIAMQYRHVYVASVAMGAKDEHTLKAFLEAEAYDGPSLIIAYSHCIAHGIDMATGMRNQKAAVQSGHWLLYRYHPERGLEGKNPLQLDSAPPHMPLGDFLQMENRFRMLSKSNPDAARALFKRAEIDSRARFALYQQLATREVKPPGAQNGGGDGNAPATADAGAGSERP
jgi:pyruvate-ferredoxin/flavodoxin oxidoreductase